MTTYVLTAIGDDRPGLVSALSAVVDDHSGNWVDSSLALLGGKFAGIVLVDIAEQRAEGFVQELATLAEQVGLRVEATATHAAPAAPTDAAEAVGSALRLHLLGQDRAGTVREVTTALASAHATIDELRTWTRAAPEGGGLLFEAEAQVRLAPGSDAEAVREALERIAGELMVDVDLDDLAQTEPVQTDPAQTD